jgi:hypothetical protein
MPRVLLWELKRLRGGTLDAAQVCRLFSASKEAAQNQLEKLPAAESANAYSGTEHELLRAYINLLPVPGRPDFG